MFDLPGTSTIKTVATNAITFTVAAALFLAWNTFWENPKLVAGTRASVEAELENNFFNAVGNLQDEADQATAARAWCIERGKLFDIGRLECVE